MSSEPRTEVGLADVAPELHTAMMNFMAVAYPGKVDIVTRELVRIYSGRESHCRICRNFRLRVAIDRGFDESMVEQMDDLESSDLAPHQKAALRLAHDFLGDPRVRRRCAGRVARALHPRAGCRAVPRPRALPARLEAHRRRGRRTRRRGPDLQLGRLVQERVREHVEVTAVVGARHRERREPPAGEPPTPVGVHVLVAVHAVQGAQAVLVAVLVQLVEPHATGGVTVVADRELGDGIGDHELEELQVRGALRHELAERLRAHELRMAAWSSVGIVCHPLRPNPWTATTNRTTNRNTATRGSADGEARPVHRPAQPPGVAP